ncbi:MAG: C39 family peptidase [Anaerolineales bacterium]|nr:C39 family peptidase [Anaerolineales bacterium]
MSGKKWIIVIVLSGIALLGLTRIPVVQSQLEWRLDRIAGIVRGWRYPGETIPVPEFVDVPTQPTFVVPEAAPSATPTLMATADVELSPTPSPTPLPASFSLPEPEWEKQDWNNCGPAALSMALRYYGWPGDQFDISDYNKPDRADKNVNISELIYYVKNFAGWLEADYRVGGSVDVLQRFIAAGYPVIIEASTEILEGGGGWAAHYLLVTGYEKNEQKFFVQNTYLRHENSLTYEELEESWQPFNYIYMFVYPPEDQEQINALLGEDLEFEENRIRSLALAQMQIAADSEDAFAWFNQGTNLAGLERYDEAAQSYDRAIQLGLPWRFLRYQFGPYLAYFHSGRFEDLIAITELTLQRTPNSEEALLWRGWAAYQLGDVNAAAADFRQAYALNPSYDDAVYALEFLGLFP